MPAIGGIVVGSRGDPTEKTTLDRLLTDGTRAVGHAQKMDKK